MKGTLYLPLRRNSIVPLIVTLMGRNDDPLKPYEEFFDRSIAWTWLELPLHGLG